MGNAFEDQEGYLDKGLRENEGDAKKVLSNSLARDLLYKRGILEAFHLRALAQLWLEELMVTGLRHLEQMSEAPLKEHRDPPEPSLAPSGDSKYQARLEGGQVLWVNLDGPRTNEGYREIQINPTFPPSDDPEPLS